MTSIRIIKIVVGCILTCSLFCCKNDNQVTSSSKASPETSAQKIQTVEVVHPQTRPFSAGTEISGTAMPNQKATIHAMASGYLKEVKKDIGDRVSAGDILAVLENPDVSQYLAEAEIGSEVEQADLITLQSELKAAQVDYEIKNKIYTRLKSIFDETPKLTPIAEVEKAEGEALMAQAKISTVQAKITSKQNKIKGLEKNVGFAKTKSGMMYVKAPFSGIITKRFLDKGSMVQSGISNTSAGPLFEIQDINTVRLSLPIPESDVGAIKKGMSVDITFPEIPNKTFTSTISRTSGVLDASSKTMTVEIDIDNKDKSILPGMYAKAKMQMGSRDNVLSLPISSVVLYQDMPHVLSVEDDTVVRIRVKKGLSGKDYFEVLNTDITNESMIITQGKGLVRNGDVVKPILK